MASPAISQATRLLSPVLDKAKPKPLGQSLLQQLSQTLPAPPILPEDEKSTAAAVVTHALTLLANLKSEERARTSAERTGPQLVSPAEVRVIVCLLDLVVLEGIYPSLARGVGIPIERRTRTTAIPGIVSGRVRVRVEEVRDRKDVELLGLVVERLLELLREEDVAAEGDLLRRAGDRVLVDVIAGCAELAFNPENGGGDTGGWVEKFRILIDGTPTPQLLPLLLQLLTPQTPPFFRTPLAKTLSLIPFRRPNAVRHIIELFLSTDTPADSSSSVPPNLSIEALSKASKIICAVPSSVNAGEYFSKICAELLGLLDSEDVLMVRAAGFVIADVLGRKGRGIEETVDRVLVVPLISRFDPSISAGLKEEGVAPKRVEEKKSSSALLAFEGSPPQPARSTTSEAPLRRPLVAEMEDGTAKDLNTKLLVSEIDLSGALRHLEILLSSQPSPTLPQRLISPILPPLWALTNFAKSTGRSTWHERTLALLKTYIKTSPDQSTLQCIQAGILYSGGEAWEFGPGSEGGIEIRCRIEGAVGFDVGRAEARIREFLGLLEDGGVSSDVFNAFFLGNLRTWLGRRNSKGEDPVKMFTTLKILQEVLGGREEAIARNPTEVLQIVKGVLDEHIEYLDSLKASRRDTATPSLEGLGKIVCDSSLPGSKIGGGEGELDEAEEEERTQTLTMTLSLLSAIISNPTTKLTPTDERLIQTLQPSLAHITTSKFTNSGVKTQTLNMTSLLTLHSPSSSSATTTTTTTTTTLLTRQKETYKLALSYLHDPLIPVRAHGLYLLRELILTKSPVINIQTTLSQLITQLKDDDSFVHLNVIKCLSALTDKHPISATGMLIQAYQNTNTKNEKEESLLLTQDQTLRLGEALQSTIQRQGEALTGDTAILLTQAMLKTATRQDSTTTQIRASALSILCTAIETNPIGLGHGGVVSDALDVCLSILMLEGGVEKAVLRRAAVVCVCGVLKGLVGSSSGSSSSGGELEWREGVWEVVRGRVSEIARVVGYLRGTDSDGLVREQAGVVLENLEAVVGVWVGRGGGVTASGVGMGSMLAGGVGK